MSLQMAKRAKVVLAVGAMGAAAFFAMPSSPAAAINSVACDRSDFARFDGNGTWCFANRGTTDVRLSSVHSVRSGNNTVRFWCGSFMSTVSRNQVSNVFPCTVTRVQIL